MTDQLTRSVLCGADTSAETKAIAMKIAVDHLAARFKDGTPFQTLNAGVAALSDPDQFRALSGYWESVA